MASISLTETQLGRAIRNVEGVRSLLPAILSTEAVENIGWMMEESVLKGYTATYHLLAPEVFSRGERFYEPILHAAMDVIIKNRDDIIDDLFLRIATLPNPGHYEDWQNNRDDQGLVADKDVRRCDIIWSTMCTAINDGSPDTVCRVLAIDEMPIYMVASALEKAIIQANAEMVALLVQEFMREKAQVTQFMMQQYGFDTVDMRVFLQLLSDRAIHILYCIRVAESTGCGDITAILLPHYLECIAGHPTCNILLQVRLIYELPIERYKHVSRDTCKRFLNRDIPVEFRVFLYTLLEDGSRQG